jgi:hypothetical protein
MRDIHFSKELKQRIREIAPTAKAVFFSMNETSNPKDCKNCGGLGVIYLFVASGGPFTEVPRGENIIAHWSDDKWWAGINEGSICPDCNGTGLDPNYIAPPTRQRQLNINLKGAHNARTRKNN